VQFLHKVAGTAPVWLVVSSREPTPNRKYVNMDDINSLLASKLPARSSKQPVVDLAELLFFAYRDFISDPDAILAKSGFGRAHHRVLHFVERNPGLTVADLLDILKITKQSLARVLKDLVDSGFIEQRTGQEDRRQRLLYATPAGEALFASLAAPQERRIRAALAALDADARETIAAFLFEMINAPERSKVAKLVTREPKR